MLLKLKLTLIILSMSISFTIDAGESESPEVKELSEYIDWFFKDVNKRRIGKAKEMIPTIIKYSKKYQVSDPLMIATIISMESSWNPRSKGTIGERGLMQVHGVAARGFNLSSVDGQLEAGIKWFGICLDKCNQSVVQAYNAYGTGRCRPINSFAHRRTRHYQNAVRRHRK